MVHGRLERSELRLGEAVELRRRLGDDRRLVEPLIDNAWLDLARGSGEAARRGFLDCLALARHVGDQFNVAEALAGLSAQAALDGRHVDAARLAGASAALHERIGAPPVGVRRGDPRARADGRPARRSAPTRSRRSTARAGGSRPARRSPARTAPAPPRSLASGLWRLGRGYLSSRERRRSLRMRPSVWQCGQ